MNIVFWGVRGSIPTPLTPQQVKSKISEVVQRITPKDVDSPESKERFLASLPDLLYGTTGGNTPCIEVTGEKGCKLLFDAGSGLRVYGKNGIPPKNLHYNFIFSHFHWDHIQGFPFFDAAYNPAVAIDIYSPYERMERYLQGQMISPYYPVQFENLTHNIKFHVVKENEDFLVGDFVVRCIRLNHPGGSYAYSVYENGRKFIYCSDVELNAAEVEYNVERAAVFEGADAIVIDCQYTPEEAIKKVGWGHTAFCYAVDFASAWNIKKLYMFHHEPTFDDIKLQSMVESAKWYADFANKKNVEIYLATEGLVLKL